MEQTDPSLKSAPFTITALPEKMEPQEQDYRVSFQDEMNLMFFLISCF